MSDGIALLIFNLVVGTFTMCQALISIYKIFRRQTPVLTDIGQRNRVTIIMTAQSKENDLIRHIDKGTNIEQSLTANVPVQNADNRNDLNDEVVVSIDTMDETPNSTLNHRETRSALFTGSESREKYSPEVTQLDLESQNDEKIEGLTSKVRLLKEVSFCWKTSMEE
ncbi:1427_t:CDS:2 [Paraglomus brasilianum]|uniref:1427_t:CDS:1 n=1 Tax=Paraglomus brasilianum TaxID=144538 RepID=A0A9N9CXS6_9GLOM|nr:1427_t:CDS:2 [Paraglomus brasilianum]